MSSLGEIFKSVKEIPLTGFHFLIADGQREECQKLIMEVIGNTDKDYEIYRVYEGHGFDPLNIKGLLVRRLKDASA